MARKNLTEDEKLAAVAKLHRISGPEARQAQADRAGLTKDQQAELAEAVHSGHNAGTMRRSEPKMNTEIRRPASETWSLLVERTSARWILVRASDRDVAGAFATLDAAKKFVAENGGGRLDLGSVTLIVPQRPRAGQVSLLHYYNGVGWKDWRWCEEHPRASIGCGHLTA